MSATRVEIDPVLRMARQFDDEGWKKAVYARLDSLAEEFGRREWRLEREDDSLVVWATPRQVAEAAKALWKRDHVYVVAKPQPGAGRPALDPGHETVPVPIRLAKKHHEELERLISLGQGKNMSEAIRLLIEASAAAAS